MKFGFRNIAAISPYQRFLRELIELPVNRGRNSGVVICSGYWDPKLLTHVIDNRGTLLDELSLHCAGGFVGTVASTTASSVKKNNGKPSPWPTNYKQYSTDLANRLHTRVKVISKATLI
jgi:hypothetical protein